MAIVKKEVKPVEEEDMLDLEDTKKKFLDKHPPLSDKQVEDIKEGARVAKKKYSGDLNRLESNLMNFFKKEDPIYDPESGEVIAMMRQLPYWEMMNMIPETMLDKSLSEEEKREILKSDKGIQETTFIMMEKIISKPEHDTEWWKANATPEFMMVFSNALETVFKRLENDIDFFPE